MKKAEFIEKNFYSLTKEELRSMIRSTNKIKITLPEMINHYDIKAQDYAEYIRAMGCQLTRQERVDLLHIENETKVMVSEPENYLPPDYVLCAMYDVDFEMHDGIPMYDREGLKRAKQSFRTMMVNYENKKKGKHDPVSKLHRIDLYAMRIYRGVSRKEFSGMCGASIQEIKEMESEQQVLKSTEQLYRRTLNITTRHINELRKVMKGEATQVKDNRHIPKIEKVKVWTKSFGQCMKCESKEKLHFHHIVHYADGGQNKADNLQLLCASCHAEEHKGEKSYHMLKSLAEG